MTVYLTWGKIKNSKISFWLRIQKDYDYKSRRIKSIEIKEWKDKAVYLRWVEIIVEQSILSKLLLYLWICSRLLWNLVILLWTFCNKFFVNKLNKLIENQLVLSFLVNGQNKTCFKNCFTYYLISCFSFIYQCISNITSSLQELFLVNCKLFDDILFVTL